MPDLDSPSPIEDTGKCPKCGYTRDPGWTECPACGVIFARLRPATAELTPPPPPADDGLFNPYQAPQASVYEPVSATRGELELADPGARLLAQLINAFGAMVMLGIGIIPIFTVAQGETPGCGHFVLMAIMLLVWISWNWSWLAKYDQSVGKRMMGVRIVRSNGERASMGRLVGLRYLVGSLVLGQVPLYGIVDALFIFRDDRRCVHDHVADTIVVKTPPGWQGEPV